MSTDQAPIARRYRKKPVEIDAVQFNGNQMVDDTMQPMFDLSFVAPDWLVDAMGKNEGEEGAAFCDGGYFRIVTLEGEHLARPDDWIIRGVKGELYPCKPDIFAATYEAVQA